MPVAGYRPYDARRAANYERQRVSQPEWQAELTLVARLVSGLAPGVRWLDIPAGTGRFLPIYAAQRIVPIGLDQSPDMLTEARRKGRWAQLIHGSIFDDLRPLIGTVDYSLCLRLFNWLTPDEARAAFGRLADVTTQAIWIGLWLAETSGLPAKSAETHAEADVSRWMANAGWREAQRYILTPGADRQNVVLELRPCE